ncbi:MAG: hypoxanthine phosphoribosyltransferase [Bacteroidota bacterium]|nr:hypoxanthine phosphoribosyltransferase [Bacteroidota bacterium]MDP4211013.1 hypoxanthine phosphoribosyltransferase [Bacteroidota bacterium]MDP4248765.1 hypoxanthine phosphoribosyltransferase [Bacteroidota bacterium]
MSIIRIHDKNFKPYITAEAIRKKVAELAEALNKDYKEKNPVFIAILNGSFIFAADLFKELTIDAEISFIKLASYKGMKSGGQVITSIGLDTEIFGRHVVIIEDIVDTGKTLNEFLPQLQHQQPASLKIVALLHKPEATIYPMKVDYSGFEIPDKFVVGYGLDYNGLGRNTPAIYQLLE